MLDGNLSYNTRKALSVHIGEQAAAEITATLQKFAMRIEELERNKVNVMRITPAKNSANRKAA